MRERNGAVEFSIMPMKFLSVSVVLIGLALSYAAKADDLVLTQAQASHFAALALKCVQKEYPNKLDHVNNDADDVRSPRAMHPAFYGCFDWHSTVHGHWMLVHLLKAFPGMPEAQEIRRGLNSNLSEKNIEGEVAYLKQSRSEEHTSELQSLAYL